MSLPKASAYCATYGRPWALEESIESFLRQDYAGEKELVILNDLADNTLIFNHPQVKIVNVKDHIIPLGKKFNDTVALCTGDVLFPWEDDDVFLPNKIRYSIEHMKNGFFHTGFALYEVDDQKLVYTGNHFHCNMCVSKELWDKVGRYTEIDNCTLDVELMGRLKQEAAWVGHDISNLDVFYIYRWKTSGSYHTSGWGTQNTLKVSENAEKILSDRDKVGEYILRPNWKYDYAEAAKKALASI